MGRGGTRARPQRGPTDPAVDRLLGLPLVPRDGAGVLRGRADGRAHERALRLHQARPRGAPRPRLHLHGGLPGDDGRGRLAAERLPHAGAGAVLCRHLLPARGAARRAQLEPGDRGCGRGLGRPGGRDPRRRRAHRRLPARRSASPALRRAYERCGAGGGRFGPAPDLRRRERRLRRGPQVPAHLGLGAAAEARRGRARDPHPESHGGRGHPRSGGRRLRPLRGRRALARAALREDALRQRAARPGLPARLAGQRRPALARGDRDDARLDAARDARARGRLLLGARRRLRG